MINLKRVVSILLLAAILLTACGCGQGGASREGKSEPAHDESVEQEAAEAASAEHAQVDKMQDPTLAAHNAHNQSLPVTKQESKVADTFDLYVVNVQALEGFTAMSNGVTNYQNGIQSVFDAAYDMFSADSVMGHALAYRDHETSAASDELLWYETKADDLFRRSVQGSQFYHGNVLPQAGTLSALFQMGDGPFKADGLTLIVSNFAEPGFDLNVLSKGIEQYFDANDHSAAAVIGFTSWFDGNLYVPENDGGRYGSSFYIQNFTGDIPVYMVVVGPEASVTTFTETIFKYLKNQNIDYRSTVYTNSIYENIQAPPLSFTQIPDPKAKKITEPIWSSFNTGSFSSNDAGTAFFTTYAGIETRGSAVMENGDTGRCTQVSLISDNYDGFSQYTCDYRLYVYNDDLQDWVETGKNETSMVELEMGVLKGEVSEEVYGQPIIILASGNKQYYLIARLNFDTGSPLVRENTYRLEVQLILNRKNPDAYSDSENSELREYGITSTEYYRAIMQIGELTAPNRIWTATMKSSDRVKVQSALEHTPNLDSFLTSLAGLESKYVSDETVVEYVDILFNLPETNSRR